MKSKQLTNEKLFSDLTRLLDEYGYKIDTFDINISQNINLGDSRKIDVTFRSPLYLSLILEAKSVGEDEVKEASLLED